MADNALNVLDVFYDESDCSSKSLSFFSLIFSLIGAAMVLIPAIDTFISILLLNFFANIAA